MEIFITNLHTNELLWIPKLPAEVRGGLANKFANYAIIKNGDVKIPTGTTLDTYTWEAQFPGIKRMRDPYIRSWMPPLACDKFMRSLKAVNGQAVKARLLITETPINLDVYLQSYNPTESGGYGDITYTVTFIRAKKLEILKSAKTATPLKNAPAAGAEPRTSPPAAKTYTVTKRDTLWKIAQKLYGDGAQYTRIHDANKSMIGDDPGNIRPGQVLSIP